MNGRDKLKEAKQLKKLANYIKNHGFRSMISNGKLYAEHVSTNGEDPTLHYKWQEIENPDLTSVRKWLGML